MISLMFNMPHQESGGCIRSCSGGAQAPREEKGGGGDVGRCPTATQKHWLGTREEEAKTYLEVARGKEVPLHQQQMKDQTKQALVTEEKKQERNSGELQDSFIPNLGKKMEQNLLHSISRNMKDKNTFANGKENFPKAKCIKLTQLLMMKPPALWMRAAQQTQFPRI